MSDLKVMDPFVSSEEFFEEDEAKLAAIDAGIRASNEGRVVSLEEVRKLIPQWIAKYSSQNQQ